MQELHILKLNVSYIREMGLDPLTLILFSDHLINLLLQMSKSGTLNLYTDATGTVIHNVQGQKTYLYSKVVRPKEKLPSVSVADMFSTSHSLPRIELF